jgi:precorrin-6B methylase 2
VAFEEVMELTGRYITQTGALAAMIARLRLDEMGVAGDPAVRAQLDRVTDALGITTMLDELEPEQRVIVISFAQTYLRQALELIDNPDRPAAWTHTDPEILQAQGSASALIATLMDGAGLGRHDARILDVGTGVAGLAIAFCKTYPNATVVGLDPWEPSLELARANVAAANLDARITLVASTVEAYEDANGFDLVWFPTFFVPEAVLDDALARVHAMTRSGGEVVLGAFETPEDPLSAVVDDLRTVRSGGTATNSADAAVRLVTAGFADVREVDKTWMAPVRLVVGIKP